MKRVLLFILFAGLGVGFSQTSAITATVTDPDGQTWNNGTYSIVFMPTPGTPGPFSWQGTANFPQKYTGSLSVSGVLSVSIPNNNYIKPLGSKWQFTLCSNSSAACQNIVTPVTGASPNLSSTLSAPLIAPRFGQGFGAFGYSDAEVVTPVAPGSTYYNVTNLIQRIWTGSVWVNNAGGGGVPPAGSLEIQTSDNTGSSFVAIPNVAPGSVLASAGIGSAPAMQTKPILDVVLDFTGTTIVEKLQAAVTSLASTGGTA